MDTSVVFGRNKIILLGATGLLGTQVLKALLAKNASLRIVARGENDWRDSSITQYRQMGAEVIFGDITNENVLQKALTGCSIIINMIGVRQLSSYKQLHRIQVDLVTKLVESAIAHDIQRFLHVSCLGARKDSTSQYFQTKWQSEEIIRKTQLEWTIFRPSFLFDERFPLLDTARPLLRFKPFLPIIGSGVNHIQPVWSKDVATCILHCLENESGKSKVYDLAGPEVYTMAELLQMARGLLNLNNSIVNLPFDQANNLLSLLSKALPVGVNADLANYLTVTSADDKNEIVKSFAVQPLSLKQLLPQIMSCY